MKNNSSLLGKIKLIIALVLVLGLVIGTNVMDNTSFDIINKSVTTIYEDRLIAHDLLYKISKEIHEKQLLLVTEDTESHQKKNQQMNGTIKSLITQYEETTLTNKEVEYFDDLKKNIEELMNLETQFYQGKVTSEKEGLEEQQQAVFKKLSGTLDNLTSLQLDEGQKQVVYAMRAYQNSDLLAKMEIGALILIGLIIQVFIFYTPFRK
ncbi:MCP four helix bundle domain-containing protein [Limibacter armeniacum]|uniref:MCP four helix bundle domain-containing protein n=1 Tax=Limibacter armeniacum TaxID=466084 RepID=UPI002FE5F528